MLHQLANRFAVEEDRDWASGEIEELVAVVDAEVVVDRGEQVLRMERAFGRVFGFGVGGSDDLAHRKSTAGDQRGLSLRPVVSAEATVGRSDARSAAELAHSDDENFLVESTLVDVGDQCRERRVHVLGTQGHSFDHVPARLCVGVIVPTEIKRHAKLRSQRVDRDDSRPRLGQTSCEQTALTPQMPAITVTQLGGPGSSVAGDARVRSGR